MKFLNCIELLKYLCSAGRPFNTRTTRSVKTYLCSSKRLWCGNNVYMWPRVLLVALTEFDSVKKIISCINNLIKYDFRSVYQVLTESPYFETIYTDAYIDSFYNQYMYDKAAVWWNFLEQIQLVWFAPSAWYGDQTHEAYFNIGRT